MGTLIFHIAIATILKMFLLSSGVAYTKKEGDNTLFSCFNNGMDNKKARYKTTKLFLGSQTLQIRCYLYNINAEDNLETRRKFLLRHKSAGLVPSLQIANNTYFYRSILKVKQQAEDNASTWDIDIPRQNLTQNTDIAPTEEWLISLSMPFGSDLFTGEGTLLDTLREPILQWKLGENMSPEDLDGIIPYVTNITMTESPCAYDVVVTALICRAPVHGIYVGVSYSGFVFEDTKWFNMTKSLCIQLDDVCDDLSLVNVILTNHYLIVLTTMGLFISEDLCHPTGRILKFSKVTFNGFEMDKTAELLNILTWRHFRNNYFSANVWYHQQCLANREGYEGDVISITFDKDKTQKEVSTCFYSHEPFSSWASCLPGGLNHTFVNVIAFLIDYEQNTGIITSRVQEKSMVAVHDIKDHKLNQKKRFPVFVFPSTRFFLCGMFFHPQSHFLYAYGNEVWLSSDGGNSFQLLVSLEDEIIVDVSACVNSHSIIFVSDKGSIFFTKAGLESYARSATSTSSVFSLRYDHLGTLYLITLNKSATDRLEIRKLDVLTLVEETNRQFDHVLSPQYITEQQMVFFVHNSLSKKGSIKSSRMLGLNKGQVIKYRPIGAALIFSNDFPVKHSQHYSSSVIANVLEKFQIESEESSPCIKHTLTVVKDQKDSSVTLRLSNPGKNGFRNTDVEKTVVIPGSSSFLITRILNSETAIAEPTMPDKVPFNKGFAPRQWFMHDFGTTNGKKWNLTISQCKYLLQDHTGIAKNSIIYLDLNGTYNFRFSVIPRYTAYPMFQMRLLSLVVGNPSLLRVDATEDWDEYDTYKLNFSVSSKVYKPGKSTIAVIIPQASCVCDNAAYIITMKSGSVCGKSIHYVSPIPKTEEYWISEDADDEYDFIGLKKLPANYRPPSEGRGDGLFSENVYNADPSKLRMRNPKDLKILRLYKKCANKSSRAECNCTLAEKMSSLAAFSDCIEKVPRMKHPVIGFPITFTLQHFKLLTNLTSPYFVTITEVNNRTGWQVKGINETSGITNIRFYLTKMLQTTVYNPESMFLSIHGFELFHFKVSTIPDLSQCQLSDEFQIYVDAPFIWGQSATFINILASLTIGIIIFAVFLRELSSGNI